MQGHNLPPEPAHLPDTELVAAARDLIGAWNGMRRARVAGNWVEGIAGALIAAAIAVALLVLFARTGDIQQVARHLNQVVTCQDRYNAREAQITRSRAQASARTQAALDKLILATAHLISPAQYGHDVAVYKAARVAAGRLPIPPPPPGNCQ